MEKQLVGIPHTQRMVTFHWWLSLVISIGVFIFPAGSAISIGHDPVGGVLVAFLVACALAGVSLGMNWYLRRGLAQFTPSSWWLALRLAIGMSIFILGVLSIIELMRPEVRQLFSEKKPVE